MVAVDSTVSLTHFRPTQSAGEARQRVAEEAVVEDLLDAGRRQDRDHRVDEGELRLVRRGRGFAGVVVAHQREHAAPGRGAGEVGVAERVAGAVDAGALAVPDAEDAVVAALAAHLGLLGAPQRGRREVLVDARLEDDVGRPAALRRAPELLVEPAERRAAVAGDVAGGALADAAVARLLHQGEADDRLRAGEEDPALAEVVFVVEGDGLEAHCFLRRLPVRPLQIAMS